VNLRNHPHKSWILLQTDPLLGIGSQKQLHLTERLDGTSVSIFGNLFTKRVKNGTSVEKFELNPKKYCLLIPDQN
jgi:hypothetical protein